MFPQTNNLRIRNAQNSSTLQLPFSCSYLSCNRFFKNASGLTKHTRTSHTHTLPRQFPAPNSLNDGYLHVPLFNSRDSSPSSPPSPNLYDSNSPQVTPSSSRLPSHSPSDGGVANFPHDSPLHRYDSGEVEMDHSQYPSHPGSPLDDPQTPPLHPPRDNHFNFMFPNSPTTSFYAFVDDHIPSAPASVPSEVNGNEDEAQNRRCAPPTREYHPLINGAHYVILSYV
jgi:hypothetical protein